jgi:hypothetical protein
MGADARREPERRTRWSRFPLAFASRASSRLPDSFSFAEGIERDIAKLREHDRILKFADRRIAGPREGDRARERVVGKMAVQVEGATTRRVRLFATTGAGRRRISTAKFS